MLEGEEVTVAKVRLVMKVGWEEVQMARWAACLQVRRCTA